MSGIDIRTLTEADRDAYDRLRSVSLHSHATGEQLALAWATRPVDRIFGAFDGDRLVGAANSYSFSLSVPGGGAVNAAGLSGVGVLPTHTRKGVLRALVGAVFDSAGAGDETVTCLWASEPGIYGRFGYGVATAGIHWTLQRSDGKFVDGVGAAGTVELLDRPDPAALAPIYQRLAESTPGVIGRSQAWWERRLHDPEGTLLAAVTDGGYALYRVKGGWGDGGPDYTLHAVEVVAPDAQAYARLWRYLLDVDLVDTVTAGHRPVDEPLQWMLVSPRMMRRRVGEGLWLRVLDLPAALAARTYGRGGTLVIEMSDGAVPANNGEWSIDVADDGKASVERRSPGTPGADLALDATALGSLYLGGTRASDLVRAGRVEERRPGAALLADQMFTWSPPPWAVTWF